MKKAEKMGSENRPNYQSQVGDRLKERKTKEAAFMHVIGV